MLDALVSTMHYAITSFALLDNAVEDFGSRIRMNVDFWAAHPKSWDCGDSRYPIVSETHNFSRCCRRGLPADVIDAVRVAE
jgi:hypothetical protein